MAQTSSGNGHYTVVSSDGTELVFSSSKEANDYLQLCNAQNERIFSEAPQNGISLLRYVPCPVGPGPCLYGVIDERAYMNIFGDIFKKEIVHGCSRCGTIDHIETILV